MESAFVLKPGDVLSYELENYVVESQATYSSPTISWTEWVLSSGDPESRVILSQIGSTLRVGRPCFVEGNPGDRMVRCEGASLYLKRMGRADVTMVFDNGATRFDRAEFWHYEDREGQFVAMRRGHLGDWAIHMRPIDPELIEVFGS
ncbi:MAG: DUF4178 domain-containing protein [Candidatus Zipacnadales bacterium]